MEVAEALPQPQSICCHDARTHARTHTSMRTLPPAPHQLAQTKGSEYLKYELTPDHGLESRPIKATYLIQV